MIMENYTRVSSRRKKHVTIHRRVPDAAFQAITTEAGDRFYLNRIEEDEWDCSIASVASSQHRTCLLNTSYATLKAQAQQEVSLNTQLKFLFQTVINNYFHT